MVYIQTLDCNIEKASTPWFFHMQPYKHSKDRVEMRKCG